MVIRKLTDGLILFILAFLTMGLLSCSSSVDSSPDPGILRIMLQSDPGDTTIVIQPDTIRVSDGDVFAAAIFQGQAYQDSLFAVLYPDLRSTKQTDVTYNIIQRQSGEYGNMMIFETQIPPQQYNKIRFGIKGNSLSFRGFGAIPVELSPDATPFVTLEGEFEVKENRVTEIDLRIQPFKSLTRYKDKYLMYPQIEIADVINY